MTPGREPTSRPDWQSPAANSDTERAAERCPSRSGLPARYARACPQPDATRRQPNDVVSCSCSDPLGFIPRNRQDAKHTKGRKKRQKRDKFSKLLGFGTSRFSLFFFWRAWCLGGSLG